MKSSDRFRSVTNNSAFRLDLIIRSTLIILILSALLVPPLFYSTNVRASAPESGQQNYHQLTFKERFELQRAIEEVNWRHLIWPEVNHDPKPDFDAMVSAEVIQAKVARTIQLSIALECYWHKPVTGPQLQAEIERLVSQTRKPDILREMFEALGNDPYLIAEGLARPILANRLCRMYYAFDDRIQGPLRERVKHELELYSEPAQMKKMSGRYYEYTLEMETDEGNPSHENLNKSSDRQWVGDREWARLRKELILDFQRVTPKESDPQDITNDREFLEDNKDCCTTEQDLDASWAALRPGSWSRLTEDETCFTVMIIRAKGSDFVTLGKMVWLKTPFDEWLGTISAQLPKAIQEPDYPYSIPECAHADATRNDSWELMGLQERIVHSAVWTGTEMIVFGGYVAGNTGARYDPLTHTWTPLSQNNAPSARYRHTAVWTGSEMLVWGGADSNGRSCLSTGGKFNPLTNSWSTITNKEAPTARAEHTAVWNGSTMLIWGGRNFQARDNFISGAQYNPVTNSWKNTSEFNAPTPRHSHSAVWTGSEMIVWGGFTTSSKGALLNTGGRYNPTNDAWEPTSLQNAPTPTAWHTAVWTGQEMITWGYKEIPGGRYNPANDSWTSISTVDAPLGTNSHTVVWTGQEMITWGGWNVPTQDNVNEGGRYNPDTDSWVLTPTINAPLPRQYHSAIWTGSEMIICGGADEVMTPQTIRSNILGRYSPLADIWTLESTLPPDTPLAREHHSAIWTGTEMIIWGGTDSYIDVYKTNTGGRFNPIFNNWMATSTIDAPGKAAQHAAIWTGTTMLIWGGISSCGKYNPIADTWSAASTVNAPHFGSSQPAVWTGVEMIVWGGYDDDLYDYTNKGSRYNPMTDAWTTISTKNAPSIRECNTAIWSGDEMIIWGGMDPCYLNTGGKYDVGTDSWQALSMINAPTIRYHHTAVWTGTEMIIWGGIGPLVQSNMLGIYDPLDNLWLQVIEPTTVDERYYHSAIWTGTAMITWGGGGYMSNTGELFYPQDNSIEEVSMINVPNGRIDHTAVWTGDEMIVWGGYNDVGSMNTGGRYTPPSSQPLVPDLTSWTFLVILTLLSICIVFSSRKNEVTKS
ncbi:hypothetical protein JXQ70_02550 [bacterium]|nr:hypothetical protein [bacterium]